MIIGAEKTYLPAKEINETERGVKKFGGSATDSSGNWSITVYNDTYIDRNDKNRQYVNPYLLKNGTYQPDSFTNLYIEDTFTGGVGEPEIYKFVVYIGGMDNSGKAISYTAGTNIDIARQLRKIEQENLTREEVKGSLQPGDYAIYNNGNVTYTFMLKWWNMNDDSGLKYDDLDSIKKHGGVGNYLKKAHSEIFGELSDETVQRMNDIFRGKALQNLDIGIRYNYERVTENTEQTNTVKYFSEQTGERTATATLMMFPPKGNAILNTRNVSVSLEKRDAETKELLSKGFEFKLQETTDNGISFSDVSIDEGKLVKGTLLENGNIALDNGKIEVRSLDINKKYRFMEVATPKEYSSVSENLNNPNSIDNPKASNSVLIDFENNDTPNVVMYNVKIDNKDDGTTVIIEQPEGNNPSDNEGEKPKENEPSNDVVENPKENNSSDNKVEKLKENNSSDNEVKDDSKELKKVVSNTEKVKKIDKQLANTSVSSDLVLYVFITLLSSLGLLLIYKNKLIKE